MRPTPNGAVILDQASIDQLAGLPLDTLLNICIDSTPFPQGSDTLISKINLHASEGGGTGIFWYQEPDGGYDGVRKRLNKIVQSFNEDRTSPWQAKLWGYHLAFVRTEGSAGRTTTITTIPDLDLPTEPVANVRKYSLGDTADTDYQAGGEIGLDGDAPTAVEYLGDEAQQTGFYALDSVDLFNLMVLPGDREIGDPIMAQIVGQASIYCQQKRAFLLLDAPTGWTNGSDRPTATGTEIDGLRQLVQSDHTAVFYPQIEYSDGGLKKRMGPSGLIAGLMARIDSTRGVWKAPAGIEANLRGILDLQVNLTDRENGALNKLGINCLRKFPGGFVNWGARTLAGSDDIGSEWKYIPIRRLALFIEESLYRGTKWVVFEPNDEPLWAQIRLNLSAFMMDLFRRGAFQGSTPDHAFFVKCDGETTTQNDRNLGIVNIDVGFAPLKPAEFVVIRIQQMAGELG
ncbi:MAG: phage tail sheath subtilisin-like domain-containing protein [Proteobacteria bacterium]|nr:phage tail sheath subtilisin-like domain-containing protein [Pseudomonadota bacterium]